MSVSRARASPYVVSRRLGRRAISRALAARRQPRSSRAPLLATFFAAAPGGGHAGTTPLRTTMAPPGAEHHSHLPELTGIEYAPTPSGAIHLPAPDTQGHGHAPLERVISSRRSCRDFSPPPAGLLHLYEIAQMCWAAQGVTAPEEPPDEFGHAGASRRAAPSGGRLYPLTLYVAVSRAVGGVEPGAYEYLPLAHALRRVPSENLGASDDTRGRDAAARAHARLCDATVPQVATARRQDWMAAAAVVFVICGDAGAVANAEDATRDSRKRSSSSRRGWWPRSWVYRRPRSDWARRPSGRFRRERCVPSSPREEKERNPRSWSPSACRRVRTENTTAACDWNEDKSRETKRDCAGIETAKRCRVGYRVHTAVHKYPSSRDAHVLDSIHVDGQFLAPGFDAHPPRRR